MSTRSTHRWTIDAIEEGVARVEEDGERMITLPVYLLPAGAREGQILHVALAAGAAPGSLSLTITVDEDATAQALARSKAAMARAMVASRKHDPGGDVAL